MDANERLRGETAVVTGASRGIGREIAIRLAENGVDLALAARSTDDLEDVAAEAEAAGVETLVHATDVTEQMDVEGLFDRAFDAFGRVDVLVNNAGRYQSEARPTWEIPPDDWESVINVNLNGMYRCAREVLRRGMLEQGSGRIINMSSLFGKTGISRSGAYVASKHGVQGLTNTLSKELSDTDVRVTAICPGQVETNLTADIAEVELLDTTDVADSVMFVLAQPPSIYVPEVVMLPSDSIALYQH